MELPMTSRITSKGQITLPKEIRDKATPWLFARSRRSTTLGMERSRRPQPSGIRLTITKTTMTCDAFEVVAVPFPFTDSDETVKRPVVVLGWTHE